jgi:hypothetical protein
MSTGPAEPEAAPRSLQVAIRRPAIAIAIVSNVGGAGVLTHAAAVIGAGVGLDPVMAECLQIWVC